MSVIVLYKLNFTYRKNRQKMQRSLFRTHVSKTSNTSSSLTIFLWLKTR